MNGLMSAFIPCVAHLLKGKTRDFSVVQIMCLVFLSLGLISCDEVASSKMSPEEVTRFFQNRRCGSSPDWAIERQSSFEPTRWDHVVTVHSFADDYGVCQDLVNYLNRTSNNRHRAVQLNK